MQYILMKNSYKGSGYPAFTLIFSIMASVAFLLPENYGTFGLNDDNFHSSSNYTKKCLRNFLQYSDELRKEPQLNCQLFVVLWVSNDADVSHVSKWITVKTADLTNLK